LSSELGKWGQHHSFKVGGDFRRLEFNDYGQQNPRGAFTFDGAASGSDLADFLLGIPDTSSIAYGNADKYLRQSEYGAYFVDDWRVLPNLSVNLGLRWEFSAPITELFGRLVNLDVMSGFSAEAPVVGNNPVGSLTGMRYPAALINADRSMIEPRIGLSWRPLQASSLILRAGYGKYANTSAYTNIVQQMTQQAPLSTSLNVQNSAACPLTLANGFVSCDATTNDTFGIDPNFRVGYAQIWKLQLQHDLPLALQITGTYLGTKGTHGAQEILPNSYPVGAENPCPACQSGFVYESSGGNSMRHAGEVMLRRRLRSGFGATADYTFAKSIDDDAYLGGQGQSTSATTIAQNWRDPRAERSLSVFDQRHLLKTQMQYTSGMGLHGGTLLDGWRGRALKEWTVLLTLNTGSGLPETPIFSAAVPGTGFTGILRPSLTGAPIYMHNATERLNVAAYTAPAAGQWGNAGRYSINGPGHFSFDSTVARTFRVYKNTSLDWKAISTNLLNKVTYTSWNNYLSNAQFGLPLSAGPMRSVQIEMKLRFEK
jgi:outer membrane receptor protein involved in Fe transport